MNCAKCSDKLKPAAVSLFAIVLVLFVLFFFYMGCMEHSSVTSARGHYAYGEVQDASVRQVTDDAAPAGIRMVYSWVLEAETGGDCLCFYSSHQLAEVFLDGELVYSLTSGENSRIGGSVSSNWVFVPIYAEDAGKEVCVVLTPLFESVIGQEVTFLLGSHHTIFLDQLKRDVPQLFVAMLCVLLGIVMVFVQLFSLLRMEKRRWDMVFLGIFSVLLGIWRIVDSMSSPILFSGNPMALGYIAIGVLFPLNGSLLLFVMAFFPKRNTLVLQVVSVVSSLVSALVLVLQVLGIADFKESLFLSHILLIVTICAEVVSGIIYNRGKSSRQKDVMSRLSPLIAVGIALDLLFFYIYDSSSEIFFSLLAFVIYVAVALVYSLLDSSRKAYSDSRTGLSNKTRWNELIHDPAPVSVPTGMMMLDLNGLKRVNDTLGHEAGDRMIFNFSNILRNTLPSDSVICRWGGDEFAVMMTGAGLDKTERYIQALQNAVAAYNAENPELSISFAIGFALSAEYPGLSRAELFRIADNRMYQDKQRWYAGQ